MVPRDAVNLGPDSSYVYVVTHPKSPNAQGNKQEQGNQPVAVSETVKVLNDDGVNDAVAGDIKPGDMVITDGQLRVTPGARVAVQQQAGSRQQRAAAAANHPT